ncbi:glycosyltransferase [Candidatus Peregrinibacteria bacterium]|nr:glycosyltransferase [Candidatus Peregrinibacteria bacterium]
MMNAERWHLIEAFKKAGHCVVDVEKDNLHKYKLQNFIKALKEDFGLIIFEEMSWAIKHKFKIFFKDAHKINIPKATFISDYWIYTRSFKKMFKKNDIKTLFTCHESSYRFIGKHFSDLIERIIWVPLTIDLKQFDFPKQEKEYDFLLSGALTNITPFRGRLIDLMMKQKKYKVYHLDHPGQWRRKENRGIYAAEYYKLLAKSYFCLATTGIYNVSARKYWEISAAGSTIFGNESGHPEHFLIKNNTVYVNDAMSDKEILKIVDEAYNNKKEWQNRAKEAQKLVKQYVSTDATVKRIEEWVERCALPLAKPESRITWAKNQMNKFIFYKLLKKYKL